MSNNEKSTLAGPTRPLGSPDIPQFHLPASGKGADLARGRVYHPRVYGAAQIRFGDRKRRLEETRKVAFLVAIDPTAKTIDWDTAQATSVEASQLLKDAPVAAGYLPLSAAAMNTITFTRWARGFDRWLARTQKAEFTTSQEPPEKLTLGPKRGGVSVELVAIVWELV